MKLKKKRSDKKFKMRKKESLRLYDKQNMKNKKIIKFISNRKLWNKKKKQKSRKNKRNFLIKRTEKK